ncbi:P-loop containing nucleoside triphosphate hydrolase protein [Venturia nashicola]|uniref:RNA helicase n=1 Tax=Venturia nashicola TaxID=86259 RepID=A0A4Z1PSP0_9PEZI|nr:P-loop containing nucleoside triphosphate hydrolase protein [Venturia nashicola]TLD37937.1 P-loop containing nucleoside triphosphate hydrolase protein [Venturia nashicola]
MSGLQDDDIDSAISEFYDYIEKIAQDRGSRNSESLRKSYLERGPRGLQDQLQYLFYSHVLGRKFTRVDIDNQKTLADLRYPIEWHPQTRAKQRTVHVHIGPTNSGKTYHALKRLEQVQRGVYAGPLRLLAHEVYTRMNAGGKTCALVTGEEIRLPDGWTNTGSDTTKMISCTVEMIPLKSELDVAVIDEIQMLANDERGWAWTNAFLGVRAAEVHLCGEERALPLIQKLAASMGDKLKVHHYERLTMLKPEPSSMHGDLSKMRKGDCLVTFSVMGIHALRSQIEKLTGRRVAIIYGSLPPETRASQARLFNEPDNDYDFLVASDAIGMGLNLNIKRVIFETVQKNNGVKIVTLSNPEIRQIAGRAGRYKVAPQSPASTSASKPESALLLAALHLARPHSLDSRPPFDKHTIGLVTTLEQEDYATVVSALKTPAEPLATAGILPPDDVISRFCNYFPPGTPFSYMLTRLHEICQSSKEYHLCRLKDQTAIADAIHDVPNLDVQERLILVSAPVSVRDPIQAELIKTMATCIAEQQGGALLDLPGLNLDVLDRDIVGTRAELTDLEVLHKGIILYMWLSFRFPGVFTTRPLASHAKELVENAIEKCLKLLRYQDRSQARKELRKRAVLKDLEEDLLKKEWLGEKEGEDGIVKDKTLDGELNAAAVEVGHEEDGLSNDIIAGEASGIEEVTVTADIGLDDEGKYPEEFDGEEGDEEHLDQLVLDESPVSKENSDEGDYSKEFNSEEGKETQHDHPIPNEPPVSEEKSDEKPSVTKPSEPEKL